MNHVLLAVRNSTRRKKRTFLTLLGIVLGIASLVALISLGDGLEHTVNEQFEKIGADKIFIQAKEQGFGGEGAPKQLLKNDVTIVERVSGVRESAGLLFRSATIKKDNIQRIRYVMGVPESPEDVRLTNEYSLWEPEQGRLLTGNDRGKTVIGSDISKALQSEVHIGEKLSINDELFEIVGILKKTGDPTMDGSAIISEVDMRRLLNVPEAYSYIVAQSERSENPEEIADKVSKALRTDRKLKEGKEDFFVQTSTQAIESFSSVLGIITGVFSAIAAISVLVGSIGIANTMYAAVLERTREIGVLKAVGASRKHILLLYLWESSLLGLFGGIIGLVLGLVVSFGLGSVVNTLYGPLLKITLDPYLSLFALTFSTVIGAVSGFLPALRASKNDPVESLRYE